MSPETFGAALRDRRVEQNLTLEALSELSGVSVRGIGDIERGVSLAPQVRTVRLLADALQLRGACRESFMESARATRRQRRELASTVAPNPLTDFVGRHVELEELRSVMRSDSRPVLLWGAPGIGKTSLAMRAARAAGADGAKVLFVDLQGLDARPAPPLAVMEAILSQTGSPGRDGSADLGAAVRAWSEDAGTRYVVVLDNAGSESQVRPVLANPRASILITGRRPLLGLEDVQRIRISPLSGTESTRLLASLCPALDPEDERARELADLCGRIPLALRVAGNRLTSQPGWTADDLLRRLRRTSMRLDTLRAGDLRVRNTVDLSFEPLSESARSLFAICGLIDGSTFTADLPAAILQVPVHTAEMSLDELIELALVETSAGGQYRVHDLLRVYARDRLEEAHCAQEISAMEDRKVRWLLDETRRRGELFEPVPVQGRAPGEAVGQERSSAWAWLVANAEHWLAAFRSAHAAGLHQHVIEAADALRGFAALWPSWEDWHTVFQLSASSAVATGGTARYGWSAGRGRVPFSIRES